MRVVDATKRAGIRRYVHMSALGTRPDAASTYHRTKHAAEELVRASGLDWTILRPSMIHGPRGEFMRMQVRLGEAEGRAVPVHALLRRGAARARRRGQAAAGLRRRRRPRVRRCARRTRRRSARRTTSPGRTCSPGRELHRAVSQAVVGKRRLVMPIPAWYATAADARRARLAPTIQPRPGADEPGRQHGRRPVPLRRRLRLVAAAVPRDVGDVREAVERTRDEP